MNNESPKEIGNVNVRQKIMPINVDDMDVVTPIPIMVTGHITEIIGHRITEIIMTLQELFMEML